MDNIIPFIAERLGVAIGEEFYVNIPIAGKIRLVKYKFVNDGLLLDRGGVWGRCGFLERLASGDFEIVKDYYEPKEGETYWTYFGNWTVHEEIWDGDAYDYIHKASGCIFRTEEEALIKLPEMYEKLTGKKWMEEGK